MIFSNRQPRRYVSWAYITPTAYLAAGFAVMLGVLARLAALLSAFM